MSPALLSALTGRVYDGRNGADRGTALVFSYTRQQEEDGHANPADVSSISIPSVDEIEVELSNTSIVTDSLPESAEYDNGEGADMNEGGSGEEGALPLDDLSSSR